MIAKLGTFAEAVYENRGPDELFRFFLLLVEPTERRFETAVQYRCYDVAVECTIKLKDRERVNFLRQYLVECLGAEGSQFLREKLDKIPFNSKQ